MDGAHERFMRTALEEAVKGGAEGNMAVGAVIVRDGEVVAAAHNEANSTYDVTAHAETTAIRRLSVRLNVVNPGFRANSGPLAGCVLYATVEPCAMCCWAMCCAGISTLVIGARYARMGLAYGAYSVEKLLALTDQHVEIVSGVLHDECAALRMSTARR